MRTNGIVLASVSVLLLGVGALIATIHGFTMAA